MSFYSNKFKIIHLSFLLTIIFPIYSFSQNLVYTFNHLTTENGLTEGQFNYYVFQDKSGFVWISSITGLNRFDAKEIKQYHSNPNERNSLVSESASQSRFQEDKNGNLWFTNSSCLLRYNRRQDNFSKFQFIKPNQDTAKIQYFWAHLDDRSNYLFTSAERLLFAIDPYNPEKQYFVDSVYVGLKDKMYASPKGGQYLFFIGYGGSSVELRHYRDLNQYGSTKTFQFPKKEVKINDLIFINDNLVWVATSLGLYRLNISNGNWTAFTVYTNNKPIRNIIELELRKNSQLIMATQDSGVFVGDPTQNRELSQILSFENDIILPFTPRIDRIELDSKENLWVSTKDDGVYFTHLEKPKLDMSLVGKGKGINSIISISEGMDSSIWVLLPTSVKRLKNNRITTFPLPISGINLEQSMSIHADKEGRIWVGTLTKLFLLRKGNKNFKALDLFPSGQPLRDPGFNDFFELSSGDILIATNSKSILKVDRDITHFEWFQAKINRPRYFYQGEKNQFFIHTYQDSLIVGRLEENEKFIPDTCFSNIPFVSTIEWDPTRKKYWIATVHGLFEAQKSNITTWKIKKNESLDPDIIINSMLRSNDGRLWIAKAGNIISFDPDNGMIYSLSKSDGIQGADFKSGSAIKLSNGSFLFGGTNGLNSFFPSEVIPSVPSARPEIVEIRINQEANTEYVYSSELYKNSSYIQSLTLPFQKNNLSFKLAPLEFSDPDACQFRYQLLGSTDESIINLGTNNQLSFPNMSPGTYSLHIWASNSDGVWSEEPKKLLISVNPPWYQNIWFFILVAFFLAGIFYLMYRYRLNVILERQKLERKANEFKTLAAETETAVLRLQMDPHFIFNSMNSIAAYISEENNVQAYEYLMRFADLMRGILNNSEEKMTCLEEEIELLEKYLSTEKMRIGEKLSYSFHIDPEIDTYETEIPTMILQPFVENAIWHGISPKRGPGTVKISFIKDQKYLLCQVDDDGVGRDNAPKNPNHNSKALSITRRRLSLLNGDEEPHKPYFKYIDKKENSEKSSGTTVQFYFPIKDFK